MHEMRTYYNLAEANELVPRLEYLFSELARIQNEVNAIYAAAEEAGIDLEPDKFMDWKGLEVSGMPSLGDRIRAFSEEYMFYADEMTGLGVILCDIDKGIVGFYSWFDSQEILLSWQYGEPEVGFWHSVSEEPETRRSIAEIIPFEEVRANLH